MLQFMQIDSQFRLKVLFLWVMSVLCVVSGGLLIIPRSSLAQTPLQTFSDFKGLGFRWGDSPLDERGIPVWTYNESLDWIPEEAFLDQQRAKSHYLWVRAIIPDYAYDNPAVWINECPLVFELYLGQEKLYTSAGMKPAFKNRFEYYRLHFISFPPGASPGRTLFFRIYTPYPHSIFYEKNISRGDIDFGSIEVFLKSELKDEIDEMILGAILLVIGGGAVILFLKRHSQNSSIAFSFGATTITAGIFLVMSGESPLRFLFNLPPAWGYIGTLALYLFPVGLLTFSAHIVVPRYHRIIVRMWQFHLVYAGARLMLDISNAIFLWEGSKSFYGLTNLTLFVSTIIVARSALQGRTEARILTIGYLIFGASTLPDLLDALDIIPSPPAWIPDPLFPYGLLALILALLYLLEQRFAKAEKVVYETIKARQEKELAEAANQAKSRFLSNMSHELRTPLNAILGYTQILKRDTTLTEKQRNAVDTIHRSGERLLSMIDEVLDLSKIEARKMELEPVAFHLPGFLKSIEDIIRVRAQQKGVTFICEIPSDLPTAVYGDEKRLWQILSNLLNNAVKFTEKGRVTLRVNARSTGVMEYWSTGKESAQTTTPTLQHSNTPILLSFEVSDTGIGIAPDRIREIFQPFQQVSDTQTHRREGTGLGLAISQELARLMGSELHVQSVVGQGTTFWFDVELPHVAEDTIVEKETVGKHIIGFKGESRKILVADDKEENRAVLQDILSPLGFDIMEAVDGSNALEKAKTWQPDVILMDLVMPVMDGFEATRRIRELDTGYSILDTDDQHPALSTQHPALSTQHPATSNQHPASSIQHLVIIGISANAFDHTRQKSLSAGCDDFLTKPINTDELLERLRIHLKLEWIYEEISETVASSPQTPNTLSVTAPPEEMLAALREYAELGNFTGIQEFLDELQAADPKFQPFVSKIKEFAEKFQFNQMIEFINACMKE
jgi:signal transduction histidine kinase/DNA-binding NarL/FixJ family response regulator